MFLWVAQYNETRRVHTYESTVVRMVVSVSWSRMVVQARTLMRSSPHSCFSSCSTPFPLSCLFFFADKRQLSTWNTHLWFPNASHALQCNHYQRKLVLPPAKGAVPTRYPNNIRVPYVWYVDICIRDPFVTAKVRTCWVMYEYILPPLSHSQLLICRRATYFSGSILELCYAGLHLILLFLAGGPFPLFPFCFSWNLFVYVRACCPRASTVPQTYHSTAQPTSPAQSTCRSKRDSTKASRQSWREGQHVVEHFFQLAAEISKRTKRHRNLPGL